ncbi:phytanoyl-CoA dioxygenase family protein [Novosphingobium sp.]|uniref:phytanoyl-CoA dioxygenase family protein n=1 Tax=Novosphingobium sp. TaxID=1874826 RepID=UPI0038B9874A
MTAALISADEVAAFARDGAVVARGVFRDWIGTIAAGIEHNLREPGPYAADSVSADQPGRFFDDYCNWQRLPDIEQVVRASPAAQLAAQAMRSTTAQFFHDHVLIKEPGTQKPTPWHQDAPYYFVEGTQTVSLWIPVEPVREATLRLIAGSHLWPKPVLPVRWATDAAFYAEPGDYLPVPDPDTQPEHTVLEWELEPGDAVLFDFRTVHGARGNPGADRRRVLSLRFVGDDARFVERPGRTSPPFPDHGMKPGERLRSDWFPILFG